VAWKEHHFQAQANRRLTEQRSTPFISITYMSMRHHIQSLGFGEDEEKDYLRWCTKHGFAAKIEKSYEQRKSEHKRYRDIKFSGVLKKSNRTRSRDLTGLIPVKKPSAMVIEFFSFFSKKTRLLPDKAKGLHTLWLHRHRFIRDYKDFKPRSKNVDKQFSQLARFLLTKYQIPVFMDQAWVSYSASEQKMTVPTKNKQIQWFIDLAQGRNIRKSKDLPCPLNKKQAHYFVQAPNQFSIVDAFRYGQIVGLGGSDTLVSEVMNKLNVAASVFNTFWDPLIWIYVNNDMLDPRTFGEIVDYVNSQKYGIDPPNPGFAFKGRTAETLLRQSEEWHTQVRQVQRPGTKTRKAVYVKWDRLKDVHFFHKEHGQFGKKSHAIWTIKELLDSTDLAEEGYRMRHCVRSYSGSCSDGRASIWSLQKGSSISGTERRCTIEIRPNDYKIVQMSGPSNRPPGKQELDIIQEWVSKNNLGFNNLKRY